MYTPLGTGRVLGNFAPLHPCSVAHSDGQREASATKLRTPPPVILGRSALRQKSTADSTGSLTRPIAITARPAAATKLCRERNATSERRRPAPPRTTA